MGQSPKRVSHFPTDSSLVDTALPARLRVICVPSGRARATLPGHLTTEFPELTSRTVLGGSRQQGLGCGNGTTSLHPMVADIQETGFSRIARRG